MDYKFVIEIIKCFGLAIVIGLSFFIVPFGLLLFGQMLPWFLTKMPFIRNIVFKKSKDRFNDDVANQKQVYINQCHPSQVIKRFKQDGIQSLFINYHFPRL